MSDISIWRREVGLPRWARIPARILVATLFVAWAILVGYRALDPSAHVHTALVVPFFRLGFYGWLIVYAAYGLFFAFSGFAVVSILGSPKSSTYGLGLFFVCQYAGLALTRLQSSSWPGETAYHSMTAIRANAIGVALGVIMCVLGSLAARSEHGVKAA